VKRISNASLIILFVLLLPIIVQGQTPCSQKLDEAQRNFEEGHFYGIPALIKDCIDRGFTKEQKIQAYKLLTITYLYIDDPFGAESSYLELLKLDPEHKVDPSIDPVEIIYLNEKFTTTPFFTLQVLKAGVNASNVTVINNYGADNTSNSLQKYKTGLGFTFGVGVDGNFNKFLSLGLEASFERRSYKYSNTFFGEDQQGYKENLTGLSIPLFLRFTYPTKKWHPYIYAGYALKLNLLSSFVDLSFDNITGQSSQLVQIPNQNGGIYRNKLTTALIGGIGVKYRINYEYLSFDIRMNAGLLNYQKVNSRYKLNNEDPGKLTDPNSLSNPLGIVLDDIRVNDLTFSIGYVKPLYKPRKKGSGNGLLGIFRKKK